MVIFAGMGHLGARSYAEVFPATGMLLAPPGFI